MSDGKDDDYFETDEWGNDIVSDQGDELPPPKPERIWHFREKWEELAKAQASAAGNDKPRRKGRQFVPGSKHDLELQEARKSSQFWPKPDPNCRSATKWVQSPEARTYAGENNKQQSQGAQFTPACQDQLEYQPISLPQTGTPATAHSPEPAWEGISSVVANEDAPWCPNSSEQRARTIWENGFAGSPYQLKRAMSGICASSGYYSSLLIGLFGENCDGLGQGEKSLSDLQKERPDIYVIKRRMRTRSYRIGDIGDKTGFLGPLKGWYRSGSRYITKDEFVDLYSAVAFANRCGYVLNGHTTILWSALGYTDHNEVAKAFLGFTRRLRDWYAQRGLEAVWIYAHENSPLAGLHTHVLLHVPASCAKELRVYIKTALSRITRIKPLPAKPRAVDIKIRIPKGGDFIAKYKNCIYIQWMWFQYICKGIDVRSEFTYACPADSDDSVQIYLSDLIRFYPQDPGFVGCKNRVGTSNNLSPLRRKIGCIRKEIISISRNFRSDLEMPSDFPGVAGIYSDKYLSDFVDSARKACHRFCDDFDYIDFDNVNFDIAGNIFPIVRGVLPQTSKAIKGAPQPKPAGIRKRKRVLVPGRLKAGADC